MRYLHRKMLQNLIQNLYKTLEHTYHLGDVLCHSAFPLLDPLYLVVLQPAEVT